MSRPSRRKLKEAEELEKYEKEFDREYAQYFHVLLHGSTDRFYADGVALDLMRNHLLYYKANAECLAKKMGVPLPAKIDGRIIPCKMPINLLIRGGENLEVKLKYMYAKEELRYSDIPTSLSFQSSNRKYRGSKFYSLRVRDARRYKND